MKKTIFGIIALLTAAVSAKAYGTFSDGPVHSSWYLDGTIVHYYTEAVADSHYLYASMDPAGRDNSAWFLLVDTQQGQTLDGGFEAIYREGYVAGFWSYSGTIDIGDRDPAFIDVSTGASFMETSNSVNFACTLGSLDEILYN